MQVNVGHGLLRGAIQGERECPRHWKGGVRTKGNFVSEVVLNNCKKNLKDLHHISKDKCGIPRQVRCYNMTACIQLAIVVYHD